MQLFIEGFAAYGAAMHPSCFEPFRVEPDPGELTEASHPGYSSQRRGLKRSEFDASDLAPRRDLRRAIICASVDPGAATEPQSRESVLWRWRHSIDTSFAKQRLKTRQRRNTRQDSLGLEGL